MTPAGGLPAEAWIVGLLSLPGLGPRRLEQLLEHSTPEGAWERLVRGRPVELDGVGAETVEKWRSVARSLSVGDRWQAIAGLGVIVSGKGAPTYPEKLASDIEPPALVFSLGATLGPSTPHRPVVGIVGTRRSTSYGARVAFELGAALAESGVSVVSGLAVGIDAAAHRGALSITTEGAGAAIGVVGSGLDVIYPRRNADLWTMVAERGTLLSETPPGVGPDRWRFPARNRIIAALADALIVVESHESGGSLITVDEAQLRDVPVGAVPGPVTSNSAAGTNRLLVDGATPVLDVSDVHSLIGFSPPRRVPKESVALDSTLLEVLGWTPLSFDQLCARLALPAAQIATQLEHLVAQGLCQRTGVWIERVR